MILEKNIKQDILPGKSDHSLEQTPAVITSPKHTT